MLSLLVGKLNSIFIMILVPPLVCCKPCLIQGRVEINNVGLSSPLVWTIRCLPVYPDICMLKIFLRSPLHFSNVGLYFPCPLRQLVGLICDHLIAWSQQDLSMVCFVIRKEFSELLFFHPGDTIYAYCCYLFSYLDHTRLNHKNLRTLDSWTVISVCPKQPALKIHQFYCCLAGGSLNSLDCFPLNLTWSL